ncbi:hypothetical protein CKA32_003092 [Geitlerinema sp. FC II]|nr:hypothetical protein CKA32_003092 [Geitlerinema sp. FC II]
MCFVNLQSRKVFCTTEGDEVRRSGVLPIPHSPFPLPRSLFPINL